MNPDRPDWMPSFSACEWQDIAPLSKAALRESAIVGNTTNTVWFRATVDDKPVACAGLIRLPREEYRLKNHFTLPAFRNRGIMKELIRLSIEHAVHANGRAVHVFTRIPHMIRFYETRDFTRMETRPNGGLHLILNLD